VLWVGKERERLPHHVAGLYVTCLWRELIQSTVELRCEHAYGIALDYTLPSYTSLPQRRFEACRIRVDCLVALGWF